MSGARSAECQCEYNFTCGYCLRNAKPWHFTPSTNEEIIARAIGQYRPSRPCSAHDQLAGGQCGDCLRFHLNLKET